MQCIVAEGEKRAVYVAEGEKRAVYELKEKSVQCM